MLVKNGGPILVKTDKGATSDSRAYVNSAVNTDYPQPPPRTPAWLPGVRDRDDDEPDAGGYWVH